MSAYNSKIEFITRLIFIFYLFVSAAGCGQSKLEKATDAPKFRETFTITKIVASVGI
jgi:hypothetical protein